MDKLQFEFCVKSSVDGKTNVIHITSITTQENRTFIIPDELQPARLHEDIINTDTYSKVKNTLKKRHQTRKVWIVLTPDLANTYMDEAGNLQFSENFLEEITVEQKPATLEACNSENLVKILEKLVENKQSNGYQNLRNISEKFVLEKFSNKNSNPNQWINTFEKECERFDIMEDEKKIEILRWFLDKSCLDWYSSMVIKLTVNSEWNEWKEKFCETFVVKGWSQIMYALLFKYKGGSLLDYAIKKERLLLEVRKTIDTDTLIDIIATGLPSFIYNKIDREVLKKTEDLFKEISRLEHLTENKNFDKKNHYTSIGSNTKNKFEKKRPCKVCEKLNKGARYHPEAICWFKTNAEKNLEPITCTNNSELETELNNINQKN